MDCPCPKCNGIDKEFHGFWGYDATYKNPVEREEEEDMSIHGRLVKVSDQLNEYGAPAHFINELNDLCDQIDFIDDEVTHLQRNCLQRPKDVTQHKLGELSKKLY
jgi:hypothetical protein